MKLDFYWNLFLELRKEVLSAQEIRSKIIGFKITFISAAIGLIYANFEKLDYKLLLIPAFASFFFDLLINSYSISVKRIGFYCRYYLEPIFNQLNEKPPGFIGWEEYVNNKLIRQRFSLIGNLGITLIVFTLAIYQSFLLLEIFQSLTIFVLLMITFIFDLYSHLSPRKKIDSLQKPALTFVPANLTENKELP